MLESAGGNFDDKIRQIYRERNARLFSKVGDQTAQGKWWLRAFWLLLVSLISVSTSLIVVAKYYPSSATVTFLNKEKEINNLIVNEKLKNGVVIIFAKKVDETTNIVENSYLVNRSLGGGLVLSSDGWVVTTSDVIKDINKKYVVGINSHSYDVEKIVKESGLPFVYLKINATGLPSFGFNDIGDVRLGDKVLSLAAGGQRNANDLRLTNIASWQTVSESAGTQNLIQSSEKVSDYFTVSQSLPVKFLGAPVVSNDNKVIGLVGQIGEEVNVVYPLHLVSPIIDDLFSGRDVYRPMFGVKYVDLNNLIIPNNQKSSIQQGALITGGNVTGIEALRPATKAGLKNGDIILEVNGQKIDGTLSLSYQLYEFNPGATIAVTVLRGDSKLRFDVVLDKVTLKSVKF